MNTFHHRRCQYNYYTIYAVVDEDIGQIYIGSSMCEKRRKQEHLNGKVDNTKLLESKYFIPLETLLVNYYMAYAVELAWIRILRESFTNVKILNGQSSIEHSKTIFEKYLNFYEERKGVDVIEFCNNQKLKIKSK